MESEAVQDEKFEVESVDHGRDGGSSLTKMLSILDLFSELKPAWSTVELIEALETSRSTGYRYIKALHSAGLLSAAGNGYYVLGPRIIELDLQIRNTDPLLQASKGVLEELVDTIGHSSLLCTVFRDSVLCIREHRAPLSPENRFCRGQSRPLFKGAVSKVILAHFPHHRLKSIFSRSQAEIMEAGLGQNWDEFRSGLSKIRKDGHLVTKGEFNPGVFGVAAPIFNDHNAVLGSLGVAWDERERRDVDFKRAVLSVKRAAREISNRLAQANPHLLSDSPTL
ncbi:IclR family transcriptional regulator [Pseudomonas fulva]|jgi:DNA-binding IclR family transcriptional regulator|uniref:IclR family transcriptional regulator n=1 Tax=Pseudomonas fulva TaxID=47880 RepID=UPI00381FED70